MHRGTSTFLYRCALMMAVVVSAAVVSAAPMYTVELVQVVHRHGSRSPIVDDNHTLICGTVFPCGFLNYEGQRMLENFGKYLRYRYTEDPEVVLEPYFSQESYNLSVSYSRSTDVLRTLQSANGMLRGLFPSIPDFYPAIHTLRADDDVLLQSSAVPILRARYKYADQERRNVCDPVLDSRMSFDQLQAVAAEVYSQKFCANYTLRSRCAMRLCDIALAYQSTGQLLSFPLLGQHLDDVCAVMAAGYHFSFAYNASNPIHKEQGASFFTLANQMVKNMKMHLNKATAPPYKLYHYSGHDTTVAPLSAAFGDSSLGAMLPPFGTAFIMELLSLADAPATSSSKFYVRLLRGHPGVTPASNFTFALSHFEMHCQDEMGNTYTALHNICPFTDFERFINSAAPTSPMGTCYLDPGQLFRMDCPIDATADNRSLSADCLFYRKRCSSYACGTGYYLDATDYGCYRIPASASTPPSPRISSGGIAALSIVLFIAGGTVSVVGVEVLRRLKKDRADKAVVVGV
ncbi:hypothetical protein, conserved [Leishmania lindenbergi]|uniref:Membrane-bound acid phosphatase n=1 Tax=Leishmania lindenbergi TaxID=651832 RepID=A0AAW2ZTA6_9TRYP